MPIPPFISCPATGDAFIGRQGLVRNFRRRVTLGESVAVLGGPKLGKTSLVRTALQGVTDRRVLELDCHAGPASNTRIIPGSVLVLDNVDSLTDSEFESWLARASGAKPASLVMTGGRRLPTMLGHDATLAGWSFRLFPLSVLLDGETRQLIGRNGSTALAAWTGNHPHLTKLLLHYMEEGGESRLTVEEAVTAGRGQWEPFVKRLAAEIEGESERRLLSYLIERGRPVNPTLAKSQTRIGDIKAVADRLVYLGVISRWLRNEEATLFAGCRLLNDFITAESTLTS